MGAPLTRVLVCGGRKFRNRQHLFDTLDRLHAERGFTLVIEGEAPGADTLAREWAEARSVPVLPFPADWDTYGEAAGRIRNHWMLKSGKPDLVVAFAGGPGTAHMVRLASRKVEVIEA